MNILRSRLTLALVAAGLVALPGCGDDTKEVKRDIDRGAGTVDERATEAARDGKDAVEDAAGDAGREVDKGADGE